MNWKGKNYCYECVGKKHPGISVNSQNVYKLLTPGNYVEGYCFGFCTICHKETDCVRIAFDKKRIPKPKPA